MTQRAFADHEGGEVFIEVTGMTPAGEPTHHVEGDLTATDLIALVTILLNEQRGPYPHSDAAIGALIGAAAKRHDWSEIPR